MTTAGLSSRPGLRAALLLSALLNAPVAGDGREPPSPTASSSGQPSVQRSSGSAESKLPKGLESLSPEQRRKLLETAEDLPFEKAEQEKDRREMVRPAPPGFKPGKSHPRLKITLIPKSTVIKSGEWFWYKLEVQNVGRKPIRYFENGPSESFLKVGGNSNGLKLGFRVAKEGSEFRWPTEDLQFGCPGGDELILPGWKAMSLAEKEKAVREFVRKDKLRHTLVVDLAPGETVVARAWNPKEDELCKREPMQRIEPTLPIGFRPLKTGIALKRPGRYRLKVVLDNPPPPPPSAEKLRSFESVGMSPKEIGERLKWEASRAFGHAESNTVVIQVLP